MADKKNFDRNESNILSLAKAYGMVDDKPKSKAKKNEAAKKKATAKKKK